MNKLKLFALTYRVLLGLSLLMLVARPLGSVQARVSAGTTYTVNTTADTTDADVLIPACADGTGKCSLRAAIVQANYTPGADTILLPANTYHLTRLGNDDVAQSGDLDITDDLTIQGAGSGTTIVDGNGPVLGDRVFQILASAKNVTISGLTIRNGKKTATFDEGGGLYWDGSGSQLHFSDVIFDRNTAYYGGGLFLNYSTSGDIVSLDHIIVHGNKAPTASAGGIGVNLGEFATFDLSNSQVYSNTAYEGGGVYFQGTTTFGLNSVRIENSQIYLNTASLSAGFENHSGDASVPVILQNSRLYQNHASLYGGAIGNYGTLRVITTTLEANTAVMRGGAIYDYEGGVLDVQQSTLNANQAQKGAAVFTELFIHNLAKLVMVNTTLSGNTASRDGGGIYATGGQVQLYNTTIANNHVLVPVGVSYPGLGAGVFISQTATIQGRNLLLGDNDHRYQALSPVPDDCSGPFQSVGYNLIETTANCSITGDLPGLITGLDPHLGPLMFNGGPTLTQAPFSASPAVDAGQTPNCLDGNDAIIPGDQRGYPRPLNGRCDIGAVERFPYAIYLPVLRR